MPCAQFETRADKEFLELKSITFAPSKGIAALRGGFAVKLNDDSLYMTPGYQPGQAGAYTMELEGFEIDSISF